MEQEIEILFSQYSFVLRNIQEQYEEGLERMGLEIGQVIDGCTIVSLDRFLVKWGLCEAIMEFGIETFSMLGIDYVLVIDEYGMCDILQPF